MAFTECIATVMVGYMRITCTDENNDQHISDIFFLYTRRFYMHTHRNPSSVEPKIFLATIVLPWPMMSCWRYLHQWYCLCRINKSVVPPWKGKSPTRVISIPHSTRKLIKGLWKCTAYHVFYFTSVSIRIKSCYLLIIYRENVKQ